VERKVGDGEGGEVKEEGELVEEGDEGDGEGAQESGHFSNILNGGLCRGAGGPYIARSSSIKFFMRLGVTGNTTEPRGLRSPRSSSLVGGEIRSWLVGRRWREGRLDTSPGQIEFILGRMNWASMGFLVRGEEEKEERWAGGG